MPADALFGSIHCHSAQFSLTAGIAPDVGVLVVPYKSVVPNKANLTLRDGIGGSVVIRDVYAVQGTTKKLPGGKTYSMQVADRRCLWKWSRIDGVYNQPNPDGTENQELGAKDLLALCFAKLPGVKSTSISVLTSIYPPVRWEAENAASAAQSVCDQCGWIISLQAGGIVRVSSVEWDPVPPAGPYKEEESQGPKRLKPASIVIVGAPTINEKTFSSLVAVGMEKNGKIRPIDDLSYKPAGGWGTEPVAGVLTFPNVAGGTYGGVAYTAAEARELAKKCIWKWYACGLTGNDRKTYLPLLDIRSEVVVLEDGTTEEHGKPYVVSENARWDGTKWKKDAKGRISTGFTLDNENGIVKFEEPVYTVTTEGPSSGAKVPPDIDLRAAYETGRYAFDYPVPGGEAGTEQIHKVPELRLYQIAGVDQNKTEVDAYARKVARGLAKEYSLDGPGSLTYPGILNEIVSGTIRSIQWSVDGQAGASTTIQKNFDAPAISGMPGFTEKLRRSRQKVILDRVNAGLAERQARETLNLDKPRPF